MNTTDERAIFWKDHIEAWSESDQSQAAYCRDQGLAYCRFIYWKQKLDPTPSRVPAARKGDFVPVQRLSLPHRGLILRFPNGITVEGIDEDTVDVARQLAELW